MYVDTVHSGLWRLHVRRGLFRCTAHSRRLLSHASWCTVAWPAGCHVGAVRCLPRHVRDDVSMFCVLPGYIRLCVFSHHGCFSYEMYDRITSHTSHVYCIFMPGIARIVSVYSHYSTCIFLHAYVSVDVCSIDVLLSATILAMCLDFFIFIVYCI